MDMGDQQRIIIVEPERLPSVPDEEPSQVPAVEPAEPDLIPAASE